jgi:protein-tyrosine kinase
VEARKVIALGKKWFWLIILAAIIGGAAGLAVSLLLPKTYESDTTLYFSSPNHTDYNSLLGDQQAAKAFASIPQSDSVLRATLQAVGDDSLTLTKFATMVTVTNNTNTPYVAIGVRDSSPQRAAHLASELTKQAIASYQTASVDPGQTQQFVQQELTNLARDIKNIEQELAKAQSQAGSTDSTSQLNANLSADRTLYNQLLSSYNQLGSTQINIVQAAHVPQNPVGLGKGLAVALGILIGLIAVVGVIILLEQTDDVLRSAEKVNLATGLSTLIAVPYLPDLARHFHFLAEHYAITDGALIGTTTETSRMNSYYEVTDNTIRLPTLTLAQKNRLLAGQRKAAEDNGNAAEASDFVLTVPLIEEHHEGSVQNTDTRIRVVSKETALTTIGSRPDNETTFELANIPSSQSARFELPEEFLTLGVLLSDENSLLDANGNQVGTLLITSPSDGEGKTLIASQVALGLARVGVKTILVDANMRKPDMHAIFGVSNSVGLSSLLSSKAAIDSALVLDVLQKTHESNLAVLPGGPAPDSLSELLSSSRMKDILHHLSEKATVVIDSPAVSTASDAIILARKCQGVLIVVDAHRTSATKLNQTLEILARVKTNILGTVLNRS